MYMYNATHTNTERVREIETVWKKRLRERERERETDRQTHRYIYIYTYIFTCTCTRVAMSQPPDIEVMFRDVMLWLRHVEWYVILCMYVCIHLLVPVHVDFVSTWILH